MVLFVFGRFSNIFQVILTFFGEIREAGQLEKSFVRLCTVFSNCPVSRSFVELLGFAELPGFAELYETVPSSAKPDNWKSSLTGFAQFFRTIWLREAGRFGKLYEVG